MINGAAAASWCEPPTRPPRSPSRARLVRRRNLRTIPQRPGIMHQAAGGGPDHRAHTPINQSPLFVLIWMIYALGLVSDGILPVGVCMCAISYSPGPSSRAVFLCLYYHLLHISSKRLSLHISVLLVIFHLYLLLLSEPKPSQRSPLSHSLSLRSSISCLISPLGYVLCCVTMLRPCGRALGSGSASGHGS